MGIFILFLSAAYLNRIQSHHNDDYNNNNHTKYTIHIDIIVKSLSVSICSLFRRTVFQLSSGRECSTSNAVIHNSWALRSAARIPYFGVAQHIERQQNIRIGQADRPRTGF